MMATVPHVTSGLGPRKFQADGFLLTRVYNVEEAAKCRLLCIKSCSQCHGNYRRQITHITT